MRLIPQPEVGDRIIVDTVEYRVEKLDEQDIYSVEAEDWQIQTPAGVGCFVWDAERQAWVEPALPEEEE